MNTKKILTALYAIEEHIAKLIEELERKESDSFPPNERQLAVRLDRRFGLERVQQNFEVAAMLGCEGER